MDKSAKYVKMCKEAEEIQRQWKPQDGDFFKDINNKITTLQIEKEGDGVCGIEVSFNNWFVYYDRKMNPSPAHKREKKKGLLKWKNKRIWLPRQDQLQEMILKEWSNSAKIDRFNEWQLNTKDLPENYSMEKLWLTFVMKEKYGKTWDGKRWKDN